MLQKKNRWNFYRTKNLMFFVFAIPLTILYVTFFIGPIISGIYYSFTDYNGISRNVQWVGWKNYLDVFKTDRFLKAAIFNLRYSFWLVLLTIVISLMLAIILNKSLKGKSFFRSMYFFPAVLPLLTMGLVFNGIYTKGIPQIGEFLGLASWQISLVSRRDTAIYAILFVNLWKGLAIPTVLFMAGLQTVPGELYESASIEGATTWQKFRHITVPFLIPTFTMVFVLTLKQGLMVYDLIMGITGGGPAGATESMALLIYNHGFVERRLSAAMAESLLLAVLVCAISFVQIAWSNKKRVYD